MNLPIEQILDVVRKPNDPRAAFDLLRDVGRSTFPSKVWDAVKMPAVETDILLAASWLHDEISDYCPMGVYLGLHPGSEQDGLGTNVSISMSKNSPPTVRYSNTKPEKEGRDHLIEGLYKIHRTYARGRLSHPADHIPLHVFYLGYGGIVLAAAVEKLKPDWDLSVLYGVPYTAAQLVQVTSGVVVRLMQKFDPSPK